MAYRLLSLVTLCLLGPRHISAGVTQTPSHQVIEKDQAVTLRCDPISGHESLLWYRRAIGEDMTFLVRFLRKEAVDKSGMPVDRFSVERDEGTVSTLKVQPAQPEDSGVYFCASSPDTVLQSQAPPVQNRTPPLLTSRANPEQKSSPELHLPRRRRTRINS